MGGGGRGGNKEIRSGRTRLEDERNKEERKKEIEREKGTESRKVVRG